MEWTDCHGRLLSRAFEKSLGGAQRGAMAFVRCLTPDVVAELAMDKSFAPAGWQIRRVADEKCDDERTLTADQAVEMREEKGEAVLLLVDTNRAGAGMDGIYSAAQEVDEAGLFREAIRLAAREIEHDLLRENQRYAKRAIGKAQGYRNRYAVSRWAEFDFLCRIVAGDRPPGAWLHLLGLWPVLDNDEDGFEEQLNTSRLFVDRLLGPAGAALAPAARVAAVRLDPDLERETVELERFLQSADTKPLPDALGELAEREDLWIGNLRIEPPAQEIRGIELVPWRNRNGTIAKWSGLVDDGDADDPPAFVMRPEANRDGRYSTLEIRWKTDPADLEKNAAEYRVAVLTDLDEELAAREVPHSARKTGEKWRFTDDDFSSLDEDTQLEARITVEVVGNDAVERQESEGFEIRFGDPPERGASGIGMKVRTFSEGLADLGSREAVSAIASAPSAKAGAKGFVLLRTPVDRGKRKSFRVFRPSLIAAVEKQWAERQGEIGRWTVRVRGSGERAEPPQFEPVQGGDGGLRERTAAASRRLAAHFGEAGGVGQVYDDKAVTFDIVQGYLRAWTALLGDRDSEPELALANTVEVRSLSGRAIGLIVLPAHPLRVAWHAAYDNLVLHTAFEQKQKARDIRDEFMALDGAMFPAFLPNPDLPNPDGGAFVFADALGFHAVGMVPDTDKEPKAAVAILARALGEEADAAPTVGNRSAEALTGEIVEYLDCHDTTRTTRLLHIHALRAGDGLTVARALGGVRRHYRQDGENPDEDSDEERDVSAPVFSLDLYPSVEQRGVTGRFIAEALEKRRRGAGVLAAEDRWMPESLGLPGGIVMPRLRWSRKERQDPETAAHLAVAFDTFESRSVVDNYGETPNASAPHHAFGLLSFYERRYASRPSPTWVSAVPPATAGEKHPSRRVHTETLARLRKAIQGAVSRCLGAGAGHPALKTEISPEKADSLAELHRLCDWVVTLDRNAGVEYFDSPRDNRDIYDAYVIDCAPEREDLGCLQLITSAANREEVRGLLDGALDRMGLSRSRRNAEFLFENLKALSGRLAIRLTGHKPAASEMISLAVSYANCRRASTGDECWVPLDDGFVVPVDDVKNLLPPLTESDGEGEKGTGPYLIYVTLAPRKGLAFRFVETKYRRHLRAARSPDMLRQVRNRIQALREQWDSWSGNEDVCAAFRAIRRAKLARVLRFYADKAHRHGLPEERRKALVAEIDRMIEKGGDYAFAASAAGDRGWVFCPEYAGRRPLEISPDDWDTRIFLFGPDLLPDSDIGFDPPPSGPVDRRPAGSVTTGREKSEGESTNGDRAGAPEGGSDSPAIDGGGGVPAIRLGANIRTNADVDWRLGIDGNPHLLIAGLPGMGKTTCLVNLCRQMVAADIRPLVFSYHQDIDERIEESVGTVRFVDFDGLGFNPLRPVDRDARMAHLDIAGAVRDIFAAIYPEIGDVQADRIRKAIKESFEEAGWEAGEAGASEPEFRRFVEILRADPNPDRGLRTLLARLGELDDYGFFETGDGSQGSLWESERPTVVRIHATQNDNLQRAFAYLVFYGLYKDMFRRGVQKRISHALIFDEAHRAARLKLVPTMAKECRKYGISLVLASQEARDFDISVFSAVANYLVLRSTDADAKFLVKNVSSSKQERALIDSIKQMERFKALYFGEGRSQPSRVALSA